LPGIVAQGQIRSFCGRKLSRFLKHARVSVDPRGGLQQQVLDRGRQIATHNQAHLDRDHRHI
jgi:hypothetical protein